ncbi:MAG: hypothetical protein AB1489_25155 [Acidobacteriota bacterium]
MGKDKTSGVSTARVTLHQHRVSTQKILLKQFRAKLKKARAVGKMEIDLKAVAEENGCTKLNLIGLAARQLVAECKEEID